mmetsp:Transcript_19019/g.31709  ORF Transcript_19019/g.31709 Transcript_19019/m.31709 type:complete len:492 (-) Transcript_19019:2664-4139(-)
MGQSSSFTGGPSRNSSNTDQQQQAAPGRATDENSQPNSIIREQNVKTKGKRPPKDPSLSVEERLARAIAEQLDLAENNKPVARSNESCVDIANRTHASAAPRPTRRLKPRPPSSTQSPINDTKSDSSSGSGEVLREPVNLRSFELLKVIGKGSHGKVYLVRHRATKQLYAMKQLKKADVIRSKQMENTKRELDVHVMLTQQEIRCPYIVPMKYAFHSRSRLYMVFNYCPGGELYYHIGQRGRLPEAFARFYAAEIALALGYLHSKGIVYRDLKPENLLLDEDGHINVVDFGLCKDGMSSPTEGSNSFCGTTEYLAPEILQCKNHGSAVDWWSFGMVLYEMLTGLPPWYSYKQKEVIDGILHRKLDFPSYVSTDAQDLIRKLLCRDPAKRMGSKHDFDDLVDHPFFSAIDWDQLAQRNIDPAFVPPNGSLACNFDSEFTSARLEAERDYLPPQSRDPFTGFYFDSEDPVNCPHIVSPTNSSCVIYFGPSRRR